MERIFYGTCYKTGNNLQLIIPKKHKEALGLEDRDEVKITLEKTGRKIDKIKEAKTTWKSEDDSSQRE